MKLDPPIKSLFVFCTNPVSQSPETNKIVKVCSARICSRSSPSTS